MKTMRQSKLLLALFALLLILGACKGESPTAPPTGGGGGGGGGTNPPPTGTTEVSLTASNASPIVDSTVTITATVTQNGQPVPNGTAVEFNSTGGGLDGTQNTSLIKTTTNGIATVTLTATTVSTVRVSAIVGNVARTVDVTFRAAETIPQPPDRKPTITEVTPVVGRPAGGERITIIGTNFRPPVRVLFDIGAPLPVEVLVESVSADGKQIVVYSPSVNIGTGQELIADIILINEVGTPNEFRIEREDAFTYRNEVLVPNISTATPNSGPVTGGTIVSILGDGFQAPVQVLFGSAEARVIKVDFGVITVEAPQGSDTSPDGSGPVTGPVTITVRNIHSNEVDTLADGFRYVDAIQIIAVSPGVSPYTGGQRVTIDGNGFVDPVVVNVRTSEGDITLQPISVTGSKIVAIAPAVDIDNCEDLQGPLVITNIVDGAQAIGPVFRFFVIEPGIIFISDTTPEPGDSITVRVANAQEGFVRFTIGETTVFPSGQTIDPVTGIGTYTITVPDNFDFPTESCSVNGVEGERELPLTLDVTYLNGATDCEDTVTDALTVLPPSGGACEVPPSPEAGVTLNPTNGSCIAFADTAVTAGTRSGTITFQNSGTAPLTVTLGTTSGANASDFTVTPPNRTIPAGGSGAFDVVFNPSDLGARNANVSFTTNDPDEGTFTICLTGNGIAP
jgi:hypothetical protein